MATESDHKSVDQYALAREQIKSIDVLVRAFYDKWGHPGGFWRGKAPTVSQHVMRELTRTRRRLTEYVETHRDRVSKVKADIQDYSIGEIGDEL